MCVLKNTDYINGFLLSTMMIPGIKARLSGMVVMSLPDKHMILHLHSSYVGNFIPTFPNGLFLDFITSQTFKNI